jgi:hypothetical protein
MRGGQQKWTLGSRTGTRDREWFEQQSTWGRGETSWPSKSREGSDVGRNFQFPKVASNDIYKRQNGGAGDRLRPETVELLWWEDLLLLLKRMRAV